MAKGMLLMDYLPTGWKEACGATTREEWLRFATK